MNVAVIVVVRMADKHRVIKRRDFDVLWTVRRCSADKTRDFLTVSDHIALGFEFGLGLFIFCGGLVYSFQGDRHPFARLQVGNVQGSVFQKRGIGTAFALVIFVLADEFIDAGILLVVAHIDNDPAVCGKSHGGILMIESAEGGVLLQEGFIEWVNLNHPAVMRIRQVRNRRGVLKVLFAGQDRVPQRHAAGAVGKRAGSRRCAFQGRDAFAGPVISNLLKPLMRRAWVEVVSIFHTPFSSRYTSMTDMPW